MEQPRSFLIGFEAERGEAHTRSGADSDSTHTPALCCPCTAQRDATCWKGSLEDLVDALHEQLVVQPDPSQLGDAVVHMPPWSKLLQHAKPALKRAAAGIGIGVGTAVTVAYKVDVKLDPAACVKEWAALQNKREERAHEIKRQAHEIKKQELAWKREDQLAERAELQAIKKCTLG